MEQDLIGQAEAADAEPSKGPPADWYPDPDQAGVERYWDGHAWTDRRAPRGPSAPAQTAAPTQPAAYWACGIAIIGMLIGAIGPWVDAGFVSAGGLEDGGDGWIVLGAGIVAGALWLGSREAPTARTVAMAILGVIAAVVAIIDIADIEGRGGLVGAVASPGWGIILSAASGGGLAAAAVVLRASRK